MIEVRSRLRSNNFCSAWPKLIQKKNYKNNYMMVIINVLCINNLQFKNTYFGDEDIGATLTDPKVVGAK